MSRTLLIPDGLANDFWLTLMAAVDNVWEEDIDAKIVGLARVHNTVLEPTSQRIDGVDLNLSSYYARETYDRETLLKLINDLGLELNNISPLLSTRCLDRLRANIGAFWLSSKGTRECQAFISYVLNVRMKIAPLYTQDYVTFVEEGSPAIGTFLEDGGSWYLTSSVNIYVDPASLVETDLKSFKEITLALLPYTTVPNRWYTLNF